MKIKEKILTNKKKILFFSLITIICIVVICVSVHFILLKNENNRVEAEINNVFEYLKIGEKSAKEKYFNFDTDNTEIDKILNDKDYYSLMLEKLNYEIIDLKVDGEKAIAIIEISNKNIGKAIYNCLVEENNSDESQSVEENEETSSFIDEIKDIDIEKNVIKIEMQKEKGKWIISNDNIKDISNSVFPGIKKTINDIANIDLIEEDRDDNDNNIDDKKKNNNTVSNLKDNSVKNSESDIVNNNNNSNNNNKNNDNNVDNNSNLRNESSTLNSSSTPTLKCDSLSHKYDVTSKIPATCTTEGSITSVCSVCGDVFTATLPKEHHSFAGGPVCTVCGSENPYYVPYTPTTSPDPLQEDIHTDYVPQEDILPNEEIINSAP